MVSGSDLVGVIVGAAAPSEGVVSLGVTGGCGETAGGFGEEGKLFP